MATQKLGRYSVFGTLAKGTFSRVRYATAGDTGESFALRIIDRTKIEQDGLLERLKNEITIMRMLSHKCVVTVTDMLASQNRIFLVLDLMMGGNLRTKILREGYLNETESRFYFHQLFCGVEYLHSMGITHGNLRCENLLLHPDGSLKITDFSLASILDGADTRTETDSSVVENSGGNNGREAKVAAPSSTLSSLSTSASSSAACPPLLTRLRILKGSPLYLSPVRARPVTHTQPYPPPPCLVLP
jgi:hypothetical protein